MNGVADTAGRWKVSAHPTGEVLVARGDGGGLCIARFGTVRDESAVGRGLVRVIRSAERSGDTIPGPIAGRMHQALARLMAADLMQGARVAAAVLHDGGDEVTVGLIGDLVIEVWLDDEPAELPWVRLRDNTGREARAHRFSGSQKVRIRITPSFGQSPDGPVLEAEWLEARTVEAADAAPEGQPEALASSGFFQWLDGMIGRHGDGEPAPSVGQPAQARDSGGGTATSTETAAPPEMTVADDRPGLGPQSRLETSTAGEAEDPAPANEEPQGDESAEVHEPAPGPAYVPGTRELDWARTAALPTLARSGGTPHAVQPLHPAWPEPEELESKPFWRKPWAWSTLVLVLMAGLLVARTVVFSNGAGKAASFLSSFMPGTRYTLMLSSRPAGASIAVDGKDDGRTTPASMELSPGTHRIVLSLPNLGSVAYSVRGERGEHVNFDAELAGSVHIASVDPIVPVSVMLDGVDQGYAPVTLDHLTPGPHEVRFAAPGTDPWSQSFEVRVGETHEIVARPFSVPDNGEIEVRASLAAEDGAEPLKGASVYVDGEPRGTTPMTLELAHGPHSIRVSFRGEDSPVQVIDLPGGNHRFADFSLGLDTRPPAMIQVAPTGPISADRPTVVAASLTGVSDTDLHEMSLHARGPDGTWRRYDMTMLKAPDAIVGVAVFPLGELDADGNAAYYMSAVTQVGDEYYTELHAPRVRGPRPPPRAAGPATVRPSAAATTPSTRP